MRYNFDPTQDTAGFPIFPKGDYRFKFGEPKAFQGETKEGKNVGEKNYGIGFTITCVEGPIDNDGGVSPAEYVGKKQYTRLYYHTQESRNFSKGTILAAFGYDQRDEQQFNEALNSLKQENPDAPELDWGFDPETGKVGRAWREMANREVVYSLSVQKDRNDKEQQKFDAIRPVPVSSESAQDGASA